MELSTAAFFPTQNIGPRQITEFAAALFITKTKLAIVSGLTLENGLNNAGATLEKRFFLVRGLKRKKLQKREKKQYLR